MFTCLELFTVSNTTFLEQKLYKYVLASRVKVGAMINVPPIPLHPTPTPAWPYRTKDFPADCTRRLFYVQTKQSIQFDRILNNRGKTYVYT